MPGAWSKSRCLGVCVLQLKCARDIFESLGGTAHIWPQKNCNFGFQDINKYNG